MKWLLVFAIVASTTASDLLQAWEMRRHGEVDDFAPRAVASWIARVMRRVPVILAFVANAVAFFALLKLLSLADLSFAIPATAASLIVETALARVLLGEHVRGARWLGCGLVAVGVALVAQG